MMKQNPALQFNVFINHRGTDVKNSLACFIYHQLKAKDNNLRVFLDKYEIPVGVDFELAIQTAIQSSSVHIAIFSEGYADSVWCLHELDLIIKSRGRLIPVFCDIEPTALRRIEKGCYQKAFEKHRGREPVEKTKRWEAALAKASNFQALKFKMKESDHWKVVEEIVNTVLHNLKEVSAVDGKYPVAPEQAVEEFRASAAELEDFKLRQEFSREEFAVAPEPDDDTPDLSEVFLARGPAVSELFEVDEDEPSIAGLFELDKDGPPIAGLFELDEDESVLIEDVFGNPLNV